MLKRYELRFAYEKKNCSVSIDTLQYIFLTISPPITVAIIKLKRGKIKLLMKDISIILSYHLFVYKYIQIIELLIFLFKYEYKIYEYHV